MTTTRTKTCDGLAQCDQNIDSVHQMAEKALLVLVIASGEHRERPRRRPSSGLAALAVMGYELWVMGFELSTQYSVLSTHI